MKANSKFVELMFNVADKQKRGFLRFREILELVIIMSKGWFLIGCRLKVVGF